MSIALTPQLEHWTGIGALRGCALSLNVYGTITEFRKLSDLAYLLSAYWPELANALSTCRGSATLCPRAWSFLWVNGTGSTPPAPVGLVQEEETRKQKRRGQVLDWLDVMAPTQRHWAGIDSLIGSRTSSPQWCGSSCLSQSPWCVWLHRWI